ncbi:MAG TPA: DUF3570 domain-containing protein [Pseudomonadales bacterium]|nr:DUF3570 domain-containing protein [Pseudomonadales bacterium]
MQLKNKKIRRSLGLITANLFLATHGYADTLDGAADAPTTSAANTSGDQAFNALGTASIDSAVLFYKEASGRVRAIEPVSQVSVTGDNGNVFTAKFTYDSLTGASPNGAAPWTSVQTFTTPAKAVSTPGSTMTVTGASGGRTIVTLPGTTTQVAQYQTQPNQLPVDSGFIDKRYAFDLGYSAKLSDETTTSFGFAASTEHDYRSWSANTAISRNFDQNNTTVELGLNVEYDQSLPIFGTPTPLTQMNGSTKGPNRYKTVTSVNLGVTQVMTRRWLFQMNYNIGWNNGYQTDPYKIVSVVNPTTGAPQQYLYEARPDHRVRQSVYIANKVALGPTVADISFRYYHDSWGIKSITSDMSERVPLSQSWYIQPELHYYQQSAADFFHYYLLGGDPLPQYASADGRLGKFRARTWGLRVGYELSRHTDIYMMAEDYKQMADSQPQNAPGALQNENFFSGVHAKSFVLGFKYTFQLSDYSEW